MTPLKKGQKITNDYFLVETSTHLLDEREIRKNDLFVDSFTGEVLEVITEEDCTVEGHRQLVSYFHMKPRPALYRPKNLPGQEIKTTMKPGDRPKLKPTDPIFNLEHQYQLYLKRVNLNEYTMHPVQKIETKRAFMGGVGQLLFLMRDDMTELGDEEAMGVLESLKNQVGKYWNQQTRGSN